MNDQKKSNLFKSNYKNVLERSFVLSTFILALIFYLYPSFNVGMELHAFDVPPDKILVPPPTRHPEKRIKPVRPKIPVAAEDEEMLEEVDIDFREMQKDWLITSLGPPTDDSTEVYDFIAVSDKPELLKKVAPAYPELARKAQVEGVVVVKILIDTNGDIEDAQIFKSIPMLDRAAIDAAMKFKFTPGKQRDRFVKVWMKLPFKFNLK